MAGKFGIYRNTNQPPEDEPDWERMTAPSWRPSAKLPTDTKFRGKPPTDFEGRFFYKADETVKRTVNLALHLRRPILVTGAPGTGKTSLAYSIAYELGLGQVLEWLITSRSTVREGLYEYDVLGRVNDMNLADKEVWDKIDPKYAEWLRKSARQPGNYITLGPLGDALLPRPKPRVLLIDEIDKCDIDLPGDLLHVLERGSYEIPELVRERDADITVRCADGGSSADDDDDKKGTVVIQRGRVACHQFPIIVLTSNEERDFPAAFRRRCLSLHLDLLDDHALEEIANERLPQVPDQGGTDLIKEFAATEGPRSRGPEGRTRATDQLLSALFVRYVGQGLSEAEFATLSDIILHPITEPYGG